MHPGVPQSQYAPPITTCPPKAGKDRNSMSNKTESSFFIVSPLAKHAGFYQQLFSGIATYEELGNRIIRHIRAAHAFRQIEQVRELSRILINIPIKEYQLIAQYYLVWCKCREYEYPAQTLERIIEQTQTYKAKALISRAAFEVYKGNMENALYFYTESLRTNPTLPDYIKASTGIAMVKSVEGFHRTALKDLENLIPLLRHAEPANYFEVINAYAVESLENSRVEQAHNASLLTVSSPFAPFYPEYQQTYSEVIRHAHKDRSTIYLPAVQPATNVVRLIPKDTPPVETKGEVIPFPEEEQEYIIDEIVDRVNRMSEPEKLAVVLKMVLQDKLNNMELTLILFTLYGKEKAMTALVPDDTDEE
jgi:tetratricopeptide (TPR) repeat protein